MTVAAPPHCPSADELDARVRFGVELDAGDVELLWQVAERRIEQGELDQGLAVLKAVALERPEDPGVYVTLGRIYQLRRAPRDACTCFAHALTLAPNEPEAACNLGQLVWELDRDADRARELLSRVPDTSATAGRARATLKLLERS